MDTTEGMRIDELARRAGVATTTVRLYQNKGLLPGPRLIGRTGYYNDAHLTRLGLVARLQEQGFSLAGVSRLLETWEDGRDLDDLVGVEVELDALLGQRHAVVLDAAELLALFPPESVTPDLIRQAGAVGLVETTDDGRFRVPDSRFLETGAALVRLGVPAETVIDEWAHLSETMDTIANRFISVFEDHLLPADWRQDLTGVKIADLGATLAQLHQAARQVLVAALDASIAREATRRLGDLVG